MPFKWNKNLNFQMLSDFLHTVITTLKNVNIQTYNAGEEICR